MVVAGRSGVGTNQESARRHNLGTALRHVHVAGRVSRAELTARMGLNRSTIGGLVAELDDLGLTEQGAPDRGTARPGAGRPSVDVTPGPRAHALAIDVRVDGLVVARVGLGGTVQARATAPSAAGHDPEATADTITDLVRLVQKDAPSDGLLTGVGIGVPGIVRAADGMVRLAPNLAWDDVPFADLLVDRLELTRRPVLANDADLGALAEHVRGAGVAVDDLVFLSGEIGVGAGVIVGGRPLGGAGGYAGEIGHMPFATDGPLCHCGAHGCWEMAVGGPAIARAIGCPEDRLPTLGEELDALDTAPEALFDVARDFGRGLAGIVNLFNPRVIVLGGYLRALHPLVGEEVHAAMEGQALLAPRQQVRLSLPALGADSVLVGASELAFEALLTDPVAGLTVG